MRCPETLMAAITAVAIGLADGRSDVEVVFMGSIFSQLGDTLATLVATREYFKLLCDEAKSKDSGEEDKQDIDDKQNKDDKQDKEDKQNKDDKQGKDDKQN